MAADYAGGMYGTPRDWKPGQGVPYIPAKTTQSRPRTNSKVQPVLGAIGTREEGLAAVLKLVAEAPEHPLWWDVAYAHIRGLEPGAVLTADLLVAEVGLPWEEVRANRNNAVGALFMQAKKDGLLVKVAGAYVPSTRPRNRGAVIAVWRRTDKNAQEKEQAS